MLVVSWDYVAGIFDGEGGVTMSLNNSGTPMARMHFSNNDKGLLENIQRVVGGSIKANGDKILNGDGTPRHWQLWQNRQGELLPVLRELQSRIKRRHREIAILIAYLECRPKPGWPNDKAAHLRNRLLRQKLYEMWKEAHDLEKSGGQR